MGDYISLMCFHISILSKPNLLEDKIISYSSLFLLPYMCLVSQLCPTLCDPLDCSPPGSSVNGDSPGKNTGVGGHALLWGIFPTQGLNSGLPYCRWTLYHLSNQGICPTWTAAAAMYQFSSVQSLSCVQLFATP